MHVSSRTLRSVRSLGGAFASVAAYAPSKLACAEAGDRPEPWSRYWKWYTDSSLRAPRWPGPPAQPGERLFSRAEVAACDGSDGSPVWITYRDGVYNVTEYISQHPGGNFILNAAGGPVDSWWRYWGQHHISLDVPAVLEKLRIGRLSDWQPEEDDERFGRGVWEEEQQQSGREANRRKTQRISEMPYQTLTKSRELAASAVTPSDALFVRNHAPVPAVGHDEAAVHSISFCLAGTELTSLCLAELEAQFASVRVTSVLQCTGNRASDNITHNGYEHSGFANSDDEHIGLGMLGNIIWTGVRLHDVLRAVVPAEEQSKWCEEADLYVSFGGLDGYTNAVPLKHIMNREKDCLLAMRMNDELLLPDHGFPVRVVLPGCPGARQVKWLSEVSIGPLGDIAPWVKHYYRDRRIDTPVRMPIQSLPLNSVILSPEPGETFSKDATTLSVKGVAYPGGTDSAVESVEISTDCGQTWKDARCLWEEVPTDDSSRPRGWVRFEVNLDLPPSHGIRRDCGGPLEEVWCRATDDAGNMQPARSAPLGGYIYNGYHRVPIVRR